MKRLILMRHAKSSWKSGALTDHARPLNKRGRRDAPRIGAALREREWVPQLVLSSDSERTRLTWAGVVTELDADPEVRFYGQLYHAGPEEIVELCANLDDDVQTILVLGHNPGWEDAVEHFSGRYERITTGNCALMQAEGSWRELMSSAAWELIEVVRPREL